MSIHRYTLNGLSGYPLFIHRANGSYISDVDDKLYIDYVSFWRSIILDHSYPVINQTITKSAEMTSVLRFRPPLK
ncbi:MAG: aminotransferase class III-fold pyridoxal phosphate-dependent enzyme [Arsenophonus sp. NC-CH8-MAG3]